jgi:hypothetical protein
MKRIRRISKRRATKLRRRGEHVWFDVYSKHWCWSKEKLWDIVPLLPPEGTISHMKMVKFPDD